MDTIQNVNRKQNTHHFAQYVCPSMSFLVSSRSYQILEGNLSGSFVCNLFKKTKFVLIFLALYSTTFNSIITARILGFTGVPSIHTTARCPSHNALQHYLQCHEPEGYLLV